MSAEVSGFTASEVSVEAGKAELERLLEDPRFRVTTRQKEILKYLAERWFAGSEDSVKAYSIALDVLGRPSNFDASTDPIVRIEMSRLRAGLHAFYEAFGEAHGVVIYIPKGTYLACFSNTLPEHQCDEEASAVHSLADQNAQAGKRSFRGAYRSFTSRAAVLTFLSSAVLASIVILFAQFLTKRSSASLPPVVYVSMQAASEELRGEASLTTDMLLTALSSFQTIMVVRRDEGKAYSNAENARSYNLDLKYYGDDAARTVWWQMVDQLSGDILKSGFQKFDRGGKSDRAVREELVDNLARLIAPSRGVVSTLEMRLSKPDAIGNTCVLKAEYALDEGDAEGVKGAKSCLLRTIAAAPDDPDALALMARTSLFEALTDRTTRKLAMDYARKATSLAPLSDRAQVALMVAHLVEGRTELAIQAGNRALSLNPHNPDTMAKLALVLYIAGYQEAGVAMAHDAVRGVETIPRDVALVLALDAYADGRFSEASMLAEQINHPNFVERALQVASLGELNSSGAEIRMAELRERYSQFEKRFHPHILALPFEDDLAQRIKAGLSKAGARFDYQTVGSTTQP